MFASTQEVNWAEKKSFAIWHRAFLSRDALKRNKDKRKLDGEKIENKELFHAKCFLDVYDKAKAPCTYTKLSLNTNLRMKEDKTQIWKIFSGSLLLSLNEKSISMYVLI